MKKFGIALAVLVFSLAVGYYTFDRLGGNNPILLEIVPNSPASLAGYTYRGTPQDEKLGETFKQIETLLTLNPGKKIHTIYYHEPAGKLDTLEVFVGLDLPFAPYGMENKVFKEKSFVLATIKASKWVMPGPEKVKAKIEGFAKENKLTLSGIFIDKITSDQGVQVIAPIKEMKY